MTTSFDAPMLAGTRARARQLVADLPETLTGTVVRLQCGSMMAATPSFADEIILQVLVNRRADVLEVSQVSDPEFFGYLRDQAAAHGVADRLHFS